MTRLFIILQRSICFIWNRILVDIKAYYENEQKAFYLTPAQYKANHEWLKESDSFTKANVQLKRAFHRFFKDKKTSNLQVIIPSADSICLAAEIRRGR